MTMNTLYIILMGGLVVVIPALIAIKSFIKDSFSQSIIESVDNVGEEHRLLEIKEIISSFENKEITSHQFGVAMKYVSSKWES